MTDITLYWGRQGLQGLESLGHAGHGEKGEDIVCAAVSALVHALLLGLDRVAKVEDARCVVDASVPTISMRWPEERASELDILTRTVALSLKEIAAGYAGYVRISEVHLT